MNGATVFFEMLERKNLGLQSCDATLRSWDITQLCDFVIEVDEYIPYREKQASGIFEFAATSELSGYEFPCRDLGCRLEKTEQLATFAALYADHVRLANPLPRPNWVDTPGIDPVALRMRLSADLKIVHYFRPLLEAGLASFAPDPNICEDCLNKALGNQKTVKQALDEVTAPYLRDVQISYGTNPHFPGYTIVHGQGPSELFEHSAWSRPVILDKRPRKKTWVMDYLRPVVSDIYRQDFLALIYGTSYLSNSTLHQRLVQTQNRVHPTLDRHSIDLMNTFAHSLPFLPEVDLRKLVTVRTEEPEAFQVYRRNLSQALKSAPDQDPQHLRELFEDQVLKELGQIDLTIKKNQRFLMGSLARDVVALAGFVGIGLASGWLPWDLEKAVAALGGFRCLADIKAKIDQLIMQDVSASQNKFYFLWKVQRLARRGD